MSAAPSDIVGIVAARVPLQRNGSTWTACCPFHEEQSPSFTVNPAAGTFHCFGCGANGNADDFAYRIGQGSK